MKHTVLVAGGGKSGIAAARLLLSAKKQVILYDENPDKDEEQLRQQVGAEGSLKIVLGELSDELLNEIEYCVISPGISLEQPFVIKIQKANIPIWSEIELAYHYGNGSIIAITGTNGKTTTTALVGEIMKNWVGEERAFVVGNIGIPYTEMALKMKEDSVVTAEISSFQLESAITFHPHVSAILNITPDHLNRHKTMECYIEVKESITKNQTADDFCVLNYDDEVLRIFGESLSIPVIYFSSRHELNEGLFLKDNTIYSRINGTEKVIGTVDEFHLVGQCNYENIMAAVAIASCMGVPEQVVAKTIREFRAVEHRIEFVEEKNGVRYYNDSKGTNPDAAIQAIKAMTTPTVLIGGGYDKGSDYTEWIQTFGTKIKKLLLMGATAKKIAECADANGFHEYQFVESMEEAVAVAASCAKPGEAVLLSPACASWGMFPNYEVRGKIFKELVRSL